MKSDQFESKFSNFKIKDTIFTNLFKGKKYARELYVNLHPEDDDVKESEINLLTIENVITNDIYNDLGMMIRGKLLIFVEAQSTWSENILWRMLIYLAETYKRLWSEQNINIYSTKKISFPTPELYVIYTGNKKVDKEYLELKDYFLIKNDDYSLNMKVKIITKENAKNLMTKEHNNGIIREYIEFAKIFDKNRFKYDNKKECINATINECIEKGILVGYFKNQIKEVITIMEVLFDQENATKMYMHELLEQGKEEGISIGVLRGREEGIDLGISKGIDLGKWEAVINMYKQNLIDIKKASEFLSVSEEEFLDKVNK